MLFVPTSQPSTEARNRWFPLLLTCREGTLSHGYRITADNLLLKVTVKRLLTCRMSFPGHLSGKPADEHIWLDSSGFEYSSIDL